MKFHPALVATLLAVPVLFGCGTSPKATFYSLTSSNPPDTSQPAAPYRIAIGPVMVPELVDRPQMVLRIGANKVMIAEYARWAEPLKSEIPRVIAANLTFLIGGAQVSTYPQNTNADADCQVFIDLQRFDSTLGDAATLEVLWTVLLPKSGKLRGGRSAVREAAGVDGYDALVAAHARALAAVSHDIAQAIDSLRTAR